MNEVRRRLKDGNPNGNKDLLHRFLEFRDKDGHGIPRQELEVEAFTPVFVTWPARHNQPYRTEAL